MTPRKRAWHAAKRAVESLPDPNWRKDLLDALKGIENPTTVEAAWDTADYLQGVILRYGPTRPVRAAALCCLALTSRYPEIWASALRGAVRLLGQAERDRQRAEEDHETDIVKK